MIILIVIAIRGHEEEEVTIHALNKNALVLIWSYGMHVLCRDFPCS
jgi:hypothetical protein